MSEEKCPQHSNNVHFVLLFSISILLSGTKLFDDPGQLPGSFAAVQEHFLPGLTAAE